MSDAASRPSIHEILNADAIRAVAADAGMSEFEIAQDFVPGGGVATTVFYVGMKGGEGLARILGFKCTRTAQTTLDTFYVTAVRSLFFTLADLRYGPIEASDTAAGCRLGARLPADHLSFKGTLSFELIDRGDRTEIKGTSVIGQLYDWGKGVNSMNNVYALTDTMAKRIDGRV